MISADFINFSTNPNHWTVNKIYSKLIKNKLILSEGEGEGRGERSREREKEASKHTFQEEEEDKQMEV